MCVLASHGDRLCERGRSIGGDMLLSAAIHMAFHDRRDESSPRPTSGSGSAASIAPSPETDGERGCQGAYGTVSTLVRSRCDSARAGGVAARGTGGRGGL